MCSHNLRFPAATPAIPAAAATEEAGKHTYTHAHLQTRDHIRQEQDSVVGKWKILGNMRPKERKFAGQWGSLKPEARMPDRTGLDEGVDWLMLRLYVGWMDACMMLYVRHLVHGSRFVRYVLVGA